MSMNDFKERRLVMKKLLLVAALPLLLVGCADIQESQNKPNDFGWKEVKAGEYIEVHLENEKNRYAGGSDIDLKYKVVAYQTVCEVFVELKKTNGYEENAYYVGTNLTVYHYEV